MPSGRQEPDFRVIVTREHILNGVKGDKTACGLQKGMAPVVGETVTVGLDESGLGYPTPWATWEALEPSTDRTRKYDGDIQPADIAVKVITTNDAGDKRRLAAQWPEEGVAFTVTNITSRYKQSYGGKSKPAGQINQKLSTAIRQGARGRKPRRTMRRLTTVA
jgi:hypothetical protein